LQGRQAWCGARPAFSSLRLDLSVHRFITQYVVADSSRNWLRRISPRPVLGSNSVRDSIALGILSPVFPYRPPGAQCMPADD
jgi:hypothetical protein